jgi:hypothetical protein
VPEIDGRTVFRGACTVGDAVGGTDFGGCVIADVAPTTGSVAFEATVWTPALFEAVTRKRNLCPRSAAAGM